jgi:pilus assembly protein CpaF
VLAELKINLNRREQFALEKVLVDELLGLGPWRSSERPDISDIMVNGPNQTFIERRASSPSPTSSSATRSISSRSRSGS